MQTTISLNGSEELLVGIDPAGGVVVECRNPVDELRAQQGASQNGLAQSGFYAPPLWMLQLPRPAARIFASAILGAASNR